MNKFLFLSKDNKTISQKHFEKPENIDVFCQSKEYRLNFDSVNYNCQIIFEGRRIGPIVKSEIQESLKIQINSIKTDTLTRGTLLFVKMNSTTKNKLRTFLSYEVDYVPRNENNKNFCGNMMGIPIIIDDKIIDFVIETYIKKNTINKFKLIKGDSYEMQKTVN